MTKELIGEAGIVPRFGNLSGPGFLLQMRDEWYR
jgi:hypothetical protein